MKAIVFGATGYVGQAVVCAACQQKMDILAHIRPNSATRAKFEPQFIQLGARVDATPWNQAAMAQMLRRENPDILFILIGTTRARQKRLPSDQQANASYEAIDYGLTKLITEATLEAQIQPRLIYLSALGTRARAPGGYLQARWRAEEVIRASRLPYTIARPSIIAGGDRAEFRFGEQLAAGLIDPALSIVKLLGGKKLAARLHSTHAATLAAALMRLALDPSAANQTIESENLH